MRARVALDVLEDAEELYLAASGWRPAGSLWIHPREPSRGHIARVAAYKQRQLDAAEANRVSKEEA